MASPTVLRAHPALSAIVGFFTDANINVIGFVGTPVPELSTWTLMLTGLAGLGLAGYRRSRKGSAAQATACG